MKKIILSIYLFSILSCQSDLYKNDLSKILGISNIEITNNQGTDEFGGFGEGYSLEVYELSENTVNSFIKQSSKKLPDKIENSVEWQKKDWSEIPADSSFNEIFIVCLNYSSGNKKLETQLNEIKTILNNGAYYSFYFKPNKLNPQTVQLFIFDTKGKKLYIIDSSI